MKNPLAAKTGKNPKLETHATAVKTTVYRKTSDQDAAMHVKKSVFTADNPTAHAAKITRNILAHIDNKAIKQKKNMMLFVKKGKRRNFQR